MVWLAAGCGGGAEPAPGPPDPRPNILLLLAEDLGPRVGAFGDPVAVTPNLDRLASEGVRYPNTFTTAGVCAPSRAALITGVPAIALGAQHMRTSDGERPYRAVPPPEVKAFPELLRRAGYYTYTDLKLDYQFSSVLWGTGPFTVWDDEGLGVHWRNRPAGRPFFALRNFQVTHESALLPRGGWPRSFLHLGFQLQYLWAFWDHEDVVTPDRVLIPPYYPDTPTARATLARHYNNVHRMDEQVGEILAELERDGLAESTVVIWTTDHGDGLPRAKRELYDSGIRVPLVIRWPGALRPPRSTPGASDERLVSFVDLAPTILSMAGLEAPDWMRGRVFAGNQAGAPRRYVYAAKDRIDTALDRQRAARDRRWKYIRTDLPERPGAVPNPFRDQLDLMRELWALHEAGELEEPASDWFRAPRPREALYDTRTDPHEVENLAGDPARQDVLVRMREALDDWLEETTDLGAIPEAQLIEQMWPGGQQPRTAAPEIRTTRRGAGALVALGSATRGASIGVRVNRSDWSLYVAPFAAVPGDQIEAKAVRYGWKESDVVRARVD